jgi:hypothetical protein
MNSLGNISESMPGPVSVILTTISSLFGTASFPLIAPVGLLGLNKHILSLRQRNDMEMTLPSPRNRINRNWIMNEKYERSKRSIIPILIGRYAMT